MTVGEPTAVGGARFDVKHATTRLPPPTDKKELDRRFNKAVVRKIGLFIHSFGLTNSTLVLM